MLTERRWLQWAAWAGIAYVVLLFGSDIIGGAQPQPTNLAKVTKFFTDSREAIMIKSYLSELGILFFLVFLMGLVSVLGRAEGGPEGLTAVARVSGYLVLAMAMVEALLIGSIAFMVDKVSDPRIVTSLFDIQYMALNFIWLPLAVLVGTTGWIVWETLVFPKWFAWSSFVVAVATLVRSFGIFIASGPLGPGGVIGLSMYFFVLIWVIMTSVVMLRRPVEAAVPAQPAVAPQAPQLSPDATIRLRR